MCAKGDKCKFSHDLTVERKAEKRGIYSDSDKTDGTMDDWDINKLEEVISKKHDADNKGLPPSTIVSCEFLHQIFRYVSTSLKQWKISSMVGFGSARMERHVTTDMPCLLVCLRLQLIVLGFILQRDKKKMEEQKEIISIEDLVEREVYINHKTTHSCFLFILVFVGNLVLSPISYVVTKVNKSSFRCKLVRNLVMCWHEYIKTYFSQIRNIQISVFICHLK